MLTVAFVDIEELTDKVLLDFDVNCTCFHEHFASFASQILPHRIFGLGIKFIITLVHLGVLDG